MAIFVYAENINGIYKKAAFEAARQQWLNNYNATSATFTKEKNEYLAEMAPARGHWSIIEPDWSAGKSMWTYRGAVSNGHYNTAGSWSDSLNAYNQLKQLEKEKQELLVEIKSLEKYINY